MPTALFDLDGTLTDPKVGITKSVAYALDRFDIQVVDLDTLTSYIGPPLQDSFARWAGLGRADSLTAVDYYREYFAKTGIFENRPYDGIGAALDLLRGHGWNLGVATSKPTVFASRILDHFGLTDRFSAVAGAELDGSRRHKYDVIVHALSLLGESPAPEIVMIGDREQDMAGAKQAGLASVGVTWGYGSTEELLSSGADVLVHRVEELAGAVIGARTSQHQ